MSDMTARLDALVETALATGRAVGGHLVVAEDGVVVYDRPYGLADREAGTPVSKAPLFRLASVTKPLVSIAAISLVEAGLMRLEDPVTRFLPGFRPKLKDGSTPEITLSHLLTHTSGLTYDTRGWPDNDQPASGGIDGAKLDMAENLRRIARLPLAFAPGSNWTYSVGIDVAGGAMEVAAGKSLPEIVAERVTRPLGLADTAFTVVDPERLTVPYALIDGKAVRMADPQVVPSPEGGATTFSPSRAFATDVFPSGGGGMVGNARDIVAALEVIRKGGAPLLASPVSIDALTRNFARNYNTGVPGRGFSHGWSILHTPEGSGTPHSVGTWAWGGVYGHSWFVDPVRKLTVVSFTNTTEPGRLGLSPDYVAAVYGA